MDLKQLQAFIRISECGSFSKAAEAMFITQPTLSYRISSLEQELGVKLFLREPDGVRLTESGSIFLNRIRLPVQSLEEARFHILSSKEKPSAERRLTICFPILSIQDNYMLTTDLINRFTEAYPGTEVVFSKLSPVKVQENLLSGETDLAFITTRNNAKFNDRLAFITIYSDEFVLLAPKSSDHGSDAAKILSDLPLAVAGQYDSEEMSVLLSELCLDPQIVKVSSIQDVLDFVAAGKCAAFWPKTFYERYLQKMITAVRLPGIQYRILFGALYNIGNPSQVLKDFIAFIHYSM